MCGWRAPSGQIIGAGDIFLYPLCSTSGQKKGNLEANSVQLKVLWPCIDATTLLDDEALPSHQVGVVSYTLGLRQSKRALERTSCVFIPSRHS